MIQFSKWQGCLNNFIVVFNEDNENLLPLIATAPRLCSGRGDGIGADGILHITPLKAEGQYDLNIINPDGSLAANCGNGLRCASAYIYKNRSQSRFVQFKVLDQMFTTTFVSESKGIFQIEVTMPQPALASVSTSKAYQQLLKQKFNLDISASNCIEIANPHLILSEPTLSKDLFFEISHQLQAIHDGINVHLIQNTGEQQTNVSEVRALVYERGVGPTMACGSGACAIASWLKSESGKFSENHRYNIMMPGGLLTVRFENNVPRLIGPATQVFSGSFDLTNTQD